MKYRIRNTETKNFVSKPTDIMEAKKYLALLNKNSSNGKLYELVSIEDEIEKMSSVLRPMSQDEIEAVKVLDQIKYAPGTNHTDFVNGLLEKAAKKQFEISEKQSAYLWYIIYHYRRQLNDAGLIALAERNRLY